MTCIVSVLDSAGKPASGLLLGNLNFMGGYEECKAMEKSVNGYFKVCKFSATAAFSFNKVIKYYSVLY